MQDGEMKKSKGNEGQVLVDSYYHLVCIHTHLLCLISDTHTCKIVISIHQYIDHILIYMYSSKFTLHTHEYMCNLTFMT